MKTTPLLVVALACIVLAGGALVGCSKAEDPGVPAAVTTELQGLAGAAKAAGGDYNKLSEGDKQKFIERTGSEAEARKMVTQMSSGPGRRGG